MPSIINGLFAGRAGIASHGIGIAVVGDNISNANTVGYKASRSEFADLIAGGQAPGRTIGSGSTASSTTTIFEQGSVEFTNRALDLSIDGNGFFVLADATGSRFYTRAGNFKVDPAGFIVNQDGLAVLGFPEGGSGALEPINTNSISQNSVATSSVAVSGNVDAAGAPLLPDATAIPAVTAPGVAPASTTTFTDLSNAAAYSTVVDVFDSLGENHTVSLFFYHIGANNYQVRGYVTSDDVDPGVNPPSGLPRQVFDFNMAFNANGSRTATPIPPATDATFSVPWNNGSDATGTIGLTLTPFTQFSAPANILSITQDGKGIGNVGSFSIEQDGTIFALLSNGQSAVIGKLGLVNFSSPEGLTRVGNNLLQQSPRSGEPVVGEPNSGTFGIVQSGSLELSTVDIASEFVKLITLQRGFQANSRIITTINQLLNEVIQLA